MENKTGMSTDPSVVDKKEKIREMNYVIGVFDGRSFNGSTITDYNWSNAPKMKYHYCYDWLMRAWVKFRDMEFKDGVHYSTRPQHHTLKHDIIAKLVFGKIDVAHKALYDAITWYQNIKK